MRVRHRGRALPAVTAARALRLAGAPDGGLAAAQRAHQETAPGSQEQEVTTERPSLPGGSHLWSTTTTSTTLRHISVI